MLRVPSTLSEEQEEIVRRTVDVGFAVHRELGPGFKESIYEEAFCLELDLRGMSFERQKPISVCYKQWIIPGQKLDLIVERAVIVELKAVTKLERIHEAAVISYLKATGLRLGLLINFHERLLKDGIQRLVL